MKICKIILFMVVFTTSFGQQQINKTLFFDGQNRSYIVYIPASYNANSSTPILFNFHGGGGTSSGMMSGDSVGNFLKFIVFDYFSNNIFFVFTTLPMLSL